MEAYRLTVCCVTYNHEKYISQALESFITQKTDFPFQVLVGDDTSTDGTREIIRRYAKKYPEIIKPVFHKKNIGPFNNSLSLYEMAKTQYVAICDGDDYWTDSKKLQKQVDFLDTHPEFSICFHPVVVHYENQDKEDEFWPSVEQRFYKEELSLPDLLKSNFMQTNSIVFRWRFRDENIKEFLSEEIAPGDYYLNLLHAQSGKIGFLSDRMAVYRRNNQGIWTGAGVSVDWILRYSIPFLSFLQKKQTEFHQEHFDEFYLNLFKTIVVAIKNERLDVLEKIEKKFPVPFLKSHKQLSSFVQIKLFVYTLLSIICFGKKRRYYKGIKRILRFYLHDSRPLPTF